MEDSLKNFHHISPVVQTYLKKVCLTLCCALLASATGAYLHILWDIGGSITELGCVGSIAGWVLSTPPHEEQKRIALLVVAALSLGASVGPLIELAIDFDPSIIIGAFIGSVVAFCCFSAAAMSARRGEYLHLGGRVSFGFSILYWLNFISTIFSGSMTLFKIEVYFGLLVFVGYIVVGIQEIIENAHSGDMDHVTHALALLIGFVGLFERILSIMLKNAAEKLKKRN